MSASMSASGALGSERPSVENGRIAFFRDNRLYFVSAAGGKATPSPRLRFNVPPQEIGWSPDGRRLAAVLIPDVIVVNADGTGRRTIARGSFERFETYVHVKWAPTGARVAAVFRSGDDLGVPGAREIRIVSLRGGEPRELVAGTLPTWSPDGRSLVYQRTGDPFSQTETSIRSIRLDGSRDRKIADGRLPALAPDGTRIAFLSNSSDDLMLMRADGTSARRVLPAELRTRFGVRSNISWSPDGRWIVFERTLGAGATSCCRTQIYVVRADGRSLRRIADRVDSVPAAWQPLVRPR